MKRVFLAMLFVLALSVTSFAQSNPPLQITEGDGLPRVTNATKLIFPNGSLVRTGQTLTVSLGGGGDALVANPLSQFAATTSAQLATTITNETGSTLLVFNTSPTLVTPILGVATATSLNGNTFTTGTYILTGAAGKTLTFNNSLTLAGTDATVMTFPTTSANIARTDAAQSFTGNQTFLGALLNFSTSAALGHTATVTPLQIGGNGVIDSTAARAASGSLALRQNVYFDGTNLKYISTDEASIYAQTNGAHQFYVIPSGTAEANATPVLAQTILVSGLIVFPTTMTAGGTTGAQTINKLTGSVNFAAAATSLVVTNSLVTTGSIVHAVLRTNDSTCRLANVVSAAGSFTITMTAACNAETSVGFRVTN